MAKKKMGDKLMWQESERGKKKKRKRKKGLSGTNWGYIFNTPDIIKNISTRQF
jgi:hypothetical protein